MTNDCLIVTNLCVLSRFSRSKEKQVLAQQRLYNSGHVRDPIIDYLVLFARSDREGVSEEWKRVDRFQELCRTLWIESVFPVDTL